MRGLLARLGRDVLELQGLHELQQIEQELGVVGLAQPLHGVRAHRRVVERRPQQLQRVVHVDVGPPAESLDRLLRLGLVLPVDRLDELGQRPLVPRQVVAKLPDEVLLLGGEYVVGEYDIIPFSSSRTLRWASVLVQDAMAVLAAHEAPVLALGRVVPRADLRVVNADQTAAKAGRRVAQPVDAGPVLDLGRRLEHDVGLRRRQVLQGRDGGGGYS